MKFAVLAVGVSLNNTKIKGCIGEHNTRRDAKDHIDRVSSEILFNRRPNGLCLRSYSTEPESLAFYLSPDIVGNLVWGFEIVEIE